MFFIQTRKSLIFPIQKSKINLYTQSYPQLWWISDIYYVRHVAHKLSHFLRVKTKGFVVQFLRINTAKNLQILVN